jgi:hypothetical protein
LHEGLKTAALDNERRQEKERELKDILAQQRRDVCVYVMSKGKGRDLWGVCMLVCNER